MPPSSRGLLSLERPVVDRTHSKQVCYSLTLAGIPAVAAIEDIGHDEVSVHVALWPTPRGRAMVHAYNAGFEAGDVFATGWLERHTGKYLQTPPRCSIHCRKGLVDKVARIQIEPNGYADHGRFML
jgi:hypothetical protein